MYSEDDQVHSMLGCAYPETSAHLLIAPSLPYSARIFAEELSGLRSVSEDVIQNKRILERNPVRADVFLLVLAVLLAIVQFFMVIKRMLLYHSTDGRKIIIRYIHHQDGEKN